MSQTDSPSALLTPLGNFGAKPTLLDETTECYSDAIDDPQIVVAGLFSTETQIDEQDQERDISSINDTETRKKADLLHKKFNLA